MPTVCVAQAVAALVLFGLAATASARTLLQASLTDADVLNFAYVRLSLLIALACCSMQGTRTFEVAAELKGFALAGSTWSTSRLSSTAARHSARLLQAACVVEALPALGARRPPWTPTPRSALECSLHMLVDLCTPSTPLAGSKLLGYLTLMVGAAIC